MKNLFAEQVLYTPARPIEETGGGYVVRGIRLLQFAVTCSLFPSIERALYQVLFSNTTVFREPCI
jgi:hypothetical protein